MPITKVSVAMLVASLAISLPFSTKLSMAQEAELREVAPDTSRLQRFEIQSSVLSETRLVDVYLPGGYENSDKAYPVVFLLDGEYKFMHTAGILDMLYQRGYPQMILVGIPNPDNTTRTRDMTPEAWHVEAPNGGGADAFTQFISTELVPAIDARFRTREFRTLIGHSYGGLFAVHMLGTTPDIFNAYVAISPSMHFSEGRPLETFANALSMPAQRAASLFVALGAEPGDEGDSIHRLYSVLATQARPWLDWEFQVYQDETHVSVNVPATMDGLRHVFEGFVLEGPDMPSNLSETKEHYAAVSNRMGWTVHPSPRLLMNLGYRQLMVGDDSGAVETASYFTEVYPDMGASWYSLAEIHLELKNRSAAIEAIEQYLLIAPNDTEMRKKLKTLKARRNIAR